MLIKNTLLFIGLININHYNKDQKATVLHVRRAVQEQLSFRADKFGLGQNLN